MFTPIRLNIPEKIQISRCNSVIKSDQFWGIFDMAVINLAELIASYLDLLPRMPVNMGCVPGSAGGCRSSG
jgi:hypothetical protein